MVHYPNGKKYGVMRNHKRRRGVAIVLALFLMTVLIGMLAFSVDIGYLAASKSELRRTADSAALAGAWQVLDSSIQGQNEGVMTSAVVTTTSQAATLNRVCNASPTLSTSQDISVGYLPSLEAGSSLTTNPNNPYRAVKVVIRRTEQSNGKVPYFFARIFGKNGHELTAEATAATATQVRGFNSPSGGCGDTLDILPFALDETTWNDLMNGGGTDSYRVNSATGSVVSGTDGIKEVNLYPQGTGSPGNRGTVDIGGANNSTADIARQIVHGISAEDLVDLGKPLLLDALGEMTLNGDTGISAGVKDELTSIIGQVRIIPVFSTVSMNGNNAMYKIKKWVGVRIMAVRLTGPMKSKHVMVQPAPVIIRNVVPGDASRSWSSHVYSPVVLVH
ncbi:MAG: TadG family pilus assembly protein [Pirellulales bacterium]